ncbi:Mbov_0396 family ICE element transmembrane protein [Mesomycoplasma ovipneumoniae]|uniref:Mbov_0396 family ICE element transmembrane protein n=1 Tax=Mesomycoplasma ovipneumoniae TaxID=29562 RepID=UPI00311ABBA4
MLFGIINTIAYGFFAVGWGLLVWPFVTILNIITELFGSISFDLLKNIFFGGSKEFSISQIPIVFWIITAIAVSLIIFLILQRLVRNFFLAGKQNYDSSLKNVITKTIASIVFPILFIVFLFFGLIIVSSIINLIKDSLGYHNSLVSSFVKGKTSAWG